MKKLKFLLCMLVVISLLTTLFAACGNTEDVGDSSGTVATDPGDPQGDEEELTEINMYMCTFVMQVDEATREAQEAAINAITEPEIGVHVNMSYFMGAEYRTSLPLDLAGGTQIDVAALTPGPPVNLNSLMAANQVMDIKPYLEEYGGETLALVEDYLEAVTVNGGIYMIPNYRNYASAEYVIFIKDWIDELGMADLVQEMSTWEEFEQILAAIKEKYGVAGMAAQGENNDSRVFGHGSAGVFMTGEGSFDNALVTDYLGDNLFCLATDEETDTVYNVFTSDYFVKGCETAKRWYDNGWIYADAAVTSDTYGVQMTNEVAAGFIVTSEFGVEVAKVNMCGHELYAKKLVEAPVTSGVVTRFGVCVPCTSEEPEAAVKFINLLMTNGDLVDIFAWGVEGRDWQELGTGEADLVDGYTYHNVDFVLGNAFLAHPWAGNGGDYREKAKTEHDNALISKYLGFSLDTDELDTVISSITAVEEQYLAGLTTGLYTPEDYSAFMAKLETAGIDEYINAAQTQLDAWLAQK